MIFKLRSLNGFIAKAHAINGSGYVKSIWKCEIYLGFTSKQIHNGNQAAFQIANQKTETFLFKWKLFVRIRSGRFLKTWHWLTQICSYYCQFDVKIELETLNDVDLINNPTTTIQINLWFRIFKIWCSIAWFSLQLV